MQGKGCCCCGCARGVPARTAAVAGRQLPSPSLARHPASPRCPQVFKMFTDARTKASGKQSITNYFKPKAASAATAAAGREPAEGDTAAARGARRARKK